MPPFLVVLIEYCVTEYKCFLISRQYFQCFTVLLECVLPVTIFPEKTGTT